MPKFQTTPQNNQQQNLGHLFCLQRITTGNCDFSQRPNGFGGFSRTLPTRSGLATKIIRPGNGTETAQEANRAVVPERDNPTMEGL